MKSSEGLNSIKTCIIDARVSTDKQLAGNGLDDQRRVCETFAKNRGWTVLNVFAKSYSGRAAEREDFEEILNFIQESQKRGIKIDYYLCKSIDRFTRAGHITYSEMKEKIRTLGVELVDAYNIIQKTQNTLEHLGEEYSWSVTEPSEGMELLEALRGKQEVNQILTRMISAEIQLTREGYSMRSPNDGYINKKVLVEGREQSVLAQDPERAHFYKEIFRLRALGQYSDEDIVKKINALGYRSKPHRKHIKSGDRKLVIGLSEPKKLTVKKMQRILQRTMYAGIKNEKWNRGVPVRAVFAEGEKSIVSIEEFNKANRGKIYIKYCKDQIEIHTNYSERATAKRLKYHPDYKYDKMILCAACKKPFKNSGKGNRGKLGTYYQAHHCDRTNECKKVSGRIPKEIFEENVTSLLQDLNFKDEFLKKLREKLIKKYREREREVLDGSIQIGANVTELKMRQQSVLAFIDKISNESMIREKEKEYEDLEKQINEAVEERSKMEIRERDVKAFVSHALDLMEHPIKILGNNRDPYQQKSFFNLIFEEGPTYQEVLNGTPKLTPIFKVSEAFKVKESALVIPRGIEPRFRP